MEMKMSVWFLKGSAGKCGLSVQSSGFLILHSAWQPGPHRPQKGELLAWTDRVRRMGEGGAGSHMPRSSFSTLHPGQEGE